MCTDTDLYTNVMVGRTTHTRARVCVAYASHAQCGAHTRARQVRARVSVHLCAYRYTYTHTYSRTNAHTRTQQRTRTPGRIQYNVYVYK